MYDYYTNVVCGSMSAAMVAMLANVVMLLSNLCWLHRGCGNISVTVVSRTVVVVVVVVFCEMVKCITAIIAVVVAEFNMVLVLVCDGVCSDSFNIVVIVVA